ncbi:hypothetical protein Taro_002571 [Colocasia esculenta]|uniref:Uncharacterized protein n=1 Tax=Colocasia esculenta TaxID=4460 RepID=A0A843TEJ1_COLES|nr:hypothetical protein [Colocasia esculenta]
MSSFPSGGGRAYGMDLDAVVRSWSSSPTTSAWSTHSSSPSSTLSESRSHPLAISTKRGRAPRKRPNQAYNEAAALLATACPNVFSAKGLLEMWKKKSNSHFYAEPNADLLLPSCPVLGDAGFLLQEYVPREHRLLREPSRPTSSSERSWTCPSSTSIDFQGPNSPAEVSDGLDADSILDEVAEGIDSILGNLDMNSNGASSSNQVAPYLWNPTAYGQGDWKNMTGALRRGSQDGEWWRCRTVEVLEITPELNIAPAVPPSTKKKKKEKNKKTVMQTTKKAEEDELRLGLASSSSPTQQRAAANGKAGLGLKLDYEEVLAAWSGRGSPFSDASESLESPVDAAVQF